MKRRMTKREKEILSNSLRLLQQELSPRRIFLFGSRAKGHAALGADFDLAVDGPVPGREAQRSIKERLEEIGGLHTIDLVFLRRVSKDFENLVLQTGKLLYEK
jgi:uncharacterized protein